MKTAKTSKHEEAERALTRLIVIACDGLFSYSEHADVSHVERDGDIVREALDLLKFFEENDDR